MRTARPLSSIHMPTTFGRAIATCPQLRRMPQPIGTEVGVGDLQGYVHFLARESGAFLGRLATDGSPIRAAPQRLAEGILVQTQGGGLYALNPR